MVSTAPAPRPPTAQDDRPPHRYRLPPGRRHPPLNRGDGEGELRVRMDHLRLLQRATTGLRAGRYPQRDAAEEEEKFDEAEIP